ncbi:MAG: hypothetical protein FWH08_04645 [Oscillospiraceae bacterium]|nr:hypothetical protein [Oscillospiraceae bacterium]
MKALLKATAFVMAFAIMILQVSALTSDEINAMKINVEANEISTTARAGSTFDININLFSNSNYGHEQKPITDITLKMGDHSPFVLMSGARTVSKAALNVDYSYRFSVPSDTPAGTYYIQYSVDYAYSNKYDPVTGPSTVAADIAHDTRSFYAAVYVIDNSATQSVPLTINNFSAPSRIAAESPAEISFNLINNGGTEYKNAQVTLYNGNNAVHTHFVGNIAANDATNVEFTYIFKTPETANCRIVVSYQNTAGNSASVERKFSVTVGERARLEISQISPPAEVEIGVESEINFTLVNRGTTEFKNVQAFLVRDDRQVRSAFVGTIEAQDSKDGTIKYVFPTSGGNYLIRVTYENAMGRRLTTERRFTPVFETVVDDSGTLRIQSIVPPFEELIRTTTEVKFWLTNPSANKIKGAEVFLYDEKGRELNSVYISEMEANSTKEESLTFFTAATEGVYSYTLRLNYRNADGEANNIRKSFAVNVVTEKADEENSNPSNIRIQKIDAPAVIYAGVSTKVPVTLVNSGKGNAHNVELYIVDSEGNEVVREFIGNIPTSESVTEEIRLKFDVAREVSLTMYVEFENGDQSTGMSQRSFSQMVMDYRASVTDISGYEWGIEAGSPATIEFSVLNNGSEKLSNVNAVLRDGDGNMLAESFIGVIEPSSKKERQRFRNVIFSEPGAADLSIVITYENDDMMQFSFSSSFSAVINEPWVPEPSPENGDSPEGERGEGEEVSGEGGGIPWWVWALIGGGVGTAGIVVLVIFLKKRAHKRESDEMEHFIKLMAGEATASDIPAEPVGYKPAVDNSTESPDNEVEQ